MGVGQVLSDTFGMVKARFGSLLGLWAVFLGITIVLFLVFGMVFGAVGMASVAAMSGGDPTESGMMALGGGMIVFLILFYLVYILVVMAQYASMINVASPLREASFGDAFGAGWRAAPALLLLMIVLIVGYVVVALVLGVLSSAIGGAGSIVLTLLMLAVVVWLGCRLAPLFAVTAVDGVRNPFTAIGRAWRLTEGHALTIFLASLVILVILIVIGGVALLPSFGLIAGLADPMAMADVGSALGSMGLMFLGFLVVSALFTMIYSAFQAVIHGTLSNSSGEGVVEAFA
jgi:uncharacterized membrane protein YjgN (DUF898 family)